VNENHPLTRRSVLLGAAGAAAGVMTGALPGVVRAATTQPARPPLWRTAMKNGIVYGSSTATWQISDQQYRDVFIREAGILFTEDDLLWYRLKPTPDSELDFTYGDRIVSFARRHGQLVFGAHLVWDEGFGEGWTDDDLWGLDEQQARTLLFGTLEQTVSHYKGQIAAWSVVNEAIGTDPAVRGLRTDVPWYNTIGREYVADAFRLAHRTDPNALMVLNEFGFETVNQYGDRPQDKREAALEVIDELLDQDVPVQALGIQAHLLAEDFKARFHEDGYRRFLGEVADRGLKILITEMDVLDDGLPADKTIRDRAIADVYDRYLDAALQEPAVKVVMTFGLSDRYTWLQEDYPRDDGARRRPLPFNGQMERKPAFFALEDSLEDARERNALWYPPRW